MAPVVSAVAMRPMIAPAASHTARNPTITTTLLRLLVVIWWYMPAPESYGVGFERCDTVSRIAEAAQRPQICAHTSPFENAEMSSAWCFMWYDHIARWRSYSILLCACRVAAPLWWMPLALGR